MPIIVIIIDVIIIIIILLLLYYLVGQILNIILKSCVLPLPFGYLILWIICQSCDVYPSVFVMVALRCRSGKG